jgi:hypothetical protein
MPGTRPGMGYSRAAIGPVDGRVRRRRSDVAICLTRRKGMIVGTRGSLRDITGNRDPEVRQRGCRGPRRTLWSP